MERDIMEDKQDSRDPLRSLADLLQESKRQYTQIQNELKEIEILIEQTGTEVQKLDHRTAQVTNKLRHIESNLSGYPREDIKEAYCASQDSQLRLLMLRAQSEQLQAKKESLEHQAEHLRRFLEIVDEFPGLTADRAGMVSSSTSSDKVVTRIIEAQEGERQRLARQMHDGPAQSLTNLILQAEIVERLFDRDIGQARAELVNLKNSVNATFQKTRDFIFELSPMMLDDLGVVPTLRRYIDDFQEKSGLQVAFDVVGEEKRPVPYVEVTIFRVIQELLHNVSQHAHATHVQVSLDLKGTVVGISVEDDGSGFDVDEAVAAARERKTVGIVTMQRRLEMLGGQIQFESSLGRGTKVTMEIPAF
jgi:two-component system sensor histidine kinase DegS